MSEVINNLTYNNTPITFDGKTDNIAQSDELEASLVYQDKMGTKYSRSKNIARAFNMAGISLIMTAAAIKTGSLISNAFVSNPPVISEHTCRLVDHTFQAVFTISNPGKYTIYYYLRINDQQVAKEECSEEKEYVFLYDGLNKGDKGEFSIYFTNRVDLKKTIESYTFNLEE